MGAAACVLRSFHVNTVCDRNENAHTSQRTNNEPNTTEPTAKIQVWGFYRLISNISRRVNITSNIICIYVCCAKVVLQFFFFVPNFEFDVFFFSLFSLLPLLSFILWVLCILFWRAVHGRKCFMNKHALYLCSTYLIWHTRFFFLSAVFFRRHFAFVLTIYV